MTRRLRATVRSSSGQSLVEMAMMMPFIVVLVLGVIEVSYALMDQHVVTKLAREGSNLISRDTSLQDAGNAMKSMSSHPVDFATHSALILSVIKRVSTTGAANFGKDILYQRYALGALSATSTLQTAGAGSFGGAPDYFANNADNDTNLQVTNLPTNLNVAGGLLYITEIYTSHTLITPFDRFGIQVPSTLYSFAVF
jgi:Flp pilus assembly protein TadG